MAETDIVPIENGPVTEIANLPRDLAIVKMDNDNMMALAAAHPRNYAAIQKSMMEQLQAFPEFARIARYAKPVGRMEKCPKCGAKTEYKKECPACRAPVPMNIARGLSIRSAEAIRLEFGFTKLDQTAEEIIAGEAVQLTTTIMDYQKGNVTRRSFPVSKSYKDRYGRTRRISDDRFYDLTLKAKASIQERDVIMKMVPPGMKAAIEAYAIKAQKDLLTDDAIKAMLKSFADKDVTQEMLEGVIGKPIAAFTLDDRTTLLGMWTAIEDGEMTVAEAFGADPQADGDKPKAAKLAEELAAKKKGKKPETNPDPKADEPPKQEAPPSQPDPEPQQEEPPAYEKMPEPEGEIPTMKLEEIDDLAQGSEFTVYGKVMKVDRGKVTVKGRDLLKFEITVAAGARERVFTKWRELPEHVRIGRDIQVIGKVKGEFKGKPQFTAVELLEIQ